MSGIPFDMIGFVTSILGIFGLIPLVWVVIMYQLPQYKLKHLDATIEETTTLLETAVQNGFVPGPKFVSVMETRLRSLRSFAEDLRTQVACAAGFRNQCLAAINGLSRRIDIVRNRVGLVRTRIAITSDQERRKVQAGNRHKDSFLRSFSGISFQQDESLSGDHDILKYEDLETFDLIESFAPPLESPHITIPPPMYSARAASVQYQSFRERGSATSDINALSVQRESTIRDVPFVATSPRNPCDNRTNTATLLRPYAGHGLSTSSTVVPPSTNSHPPSQLNGEHPRADFIAAIVMAPSGTGDHLPQTHRDDIQAILMEFRRQLLADQRAIACSMQNAFEGIVERTVQGPSHF